MCVCVCVCVCVLQYKDEGDFGKSPWTWSYEGSEVDVSKTLVGHYDQSTGLAVLVNGGLHITFKYYEPESWRLLRKPTLLIVCKGPEFKALESYPETICGKEVRKLRERERERETAA